LVLLHEQLDEIHFDELDHILVADFHDLKIYFDECDEILDDEQVLIWKTYLVDDFDDNIKLEKNLRKKNLLV
jgi:hypothetical protein